MNRILLFLFIGTSAYWHIGTSNAQELTLLFAGDAMQHKDQLENALIAGQYDYSSYFEYVTPEVSSADLAIVNLEATLGGKPYQGYPMFSAPDEFANSLKEAGFDIFLTANNHAADRFSKGVNRTIDVLDSLGVYHTGTFKNQEEREFSYPLIVERKGIKIAFLNYTYDTNGIELPPPCIINYIEKEQIGKDILKAKEQHADVIIANMHWGLEYKLLPNQEQKNLADFLIKNGVDIVMGSHPHVVQPSELIYNEKKNISNLIVYSLGNFVSGMKAINTDGGQMIKLKLQKNGDSVHIESCGYILHYTYKEKKKNRFIYRVMPITLVEENKYPLLRKDICIPDENSQEKMDQFAENARELFFEQNKGVDEYRIFYPDKEGDEFRKFLPVIFGK